MCEVQNEAQNASENVNKDKVPETLYHYCSLDTFYNIVKNKSIWLSDLSKTNDSQELVWLKRTTEQRLLPKIEQKINHETDEWDEWKVTKQLIEHADLRIWCWGFCLSQKSDNLGQWRGYGDDGAGIAIGFKYNKLRDTIPSCVNMVLTRSDLMFEKVVYEANENSFEKLLNEEEVGDCERKKIYETIDALLEELKYKENPVIKLSAEAKKMILMELLAMKKGRFYKMKAFEEEEEWRVVFSMPREQFSECAVKCYNWPSPLYFKEFGFNNAFTSHLDIGIQNFKDVIQSITIGPKSKLTEANIELILRWHGVYNESIKIEKSAASYR